MARAATTTDAFNAVAEPRRRQILDVLVRGERPVGDLVVALGVAQPVVSKHLKVLRDVGLVQVRDDGRQRVYRVDARPLREIHEWLAGYSDLWNERLDLLDEVLAELAAAESGTPAVRPPDVGSQHPEEQS
ncbi:metalloregulator ArsR/SmtB family transcription factor [Nakamurella sp. YIM 132087]|uniref:Metalloregulator ArsR/SmtB family transcription factor n=1 Tax=Nakamurella alba TaxID=2665158 RepID=A0A7K1FNC5_9ACTN|nr:metalloregulator ArsR/SmtB family transcription factor [Nakamurella alba]MTD14809.1 metalloregulator ArsR/SmtB family transcription factor [Nakamurella alba]